VVEGAVVAVGPTVIGFDFATLAGAPGFEGKSMETVAEDMLTAVRVRAI